MSQVWLVTGSSRGLGRAIVEATDGVHLSYDKMESLLAPYGNRDALEVARELDRKIEKILEQAAA